MRALSLPSTLDADLFKAVTTSHKVDTVNQLIDQGARLDVVFNLDYELVRDATTTFRLASLEALMVGWDLPKISKILMHWGPLPDVVLPNIATALHTIRHDSRKSNSYSTLGHYTTDEKFLVWGLRVMSSTLDYCNPSFFTPTLWECIAFKTLDKNQSAALPNIIQALRNLPPIIDENSLARVLSVAKNHENLGVLLCTKFGVAPHLHATETYQQLYQRALQNPLEPMVSKTLLESEVKDRGVAHKTVRKI